MATLDVAYETWLKVACAPFHPERFLRATINLSAQAVAREIDLAEFMSQHLAALPPENLEKLYQNICQSPQLRALLPHIPELTNADILKKLIVKIYRCVHAAVPLALRTPTEPMAEKIDPTPEPAIVKILDEFRQGKLHWDAREPNLAKPLEEFANPYDYWIFYNYRRTLKSLINLLNSCQDLDEAQVKTGLLIAKMQLTELEKLLKQVNSSSFQALIVEVNSVTQDTAFTRYHTLDRRLAINVVDLARHLQTTIRTICQEPVDYQREIPVVPGGLPGVFGWFRYSSHALLIDCFQTIGSLLAELVTLLLKDYTRSYVEDNDHRLVLPDANSTEQGWTNVVL